MKRLGTVFEILFLLFMLGLCAVILSAGSGRVPYLFGYRVLKVISGSMQPVISDETCIIIRRAEQAEIKTGDIITFVSSDPRIEGYLNTHRVVELLEEPDGTVRYITKGDAAQEPDPYPVRYADVQGIYVGEMPLGRWMFKAALFLSDRNHYFVIVILPLLLCCMSYLRELFRAIFGKDKKEAP